MDDKKTMELDETDLEKVFGGAGGVLSPEHVCLSTGFLRKTDAESDEEKCKNCTRYNVEDNTCRATRSIKSYR